VACPKPPDPEEIRDTTISLELVDVGITSATLMISVKDTTQAWDFALSRDDTILYIFQSEGPSRTLVDHDLQPNREYAYTAYFMEEGVISDSSLTITIHTEEATSHSFNWEIDTLGSIGSVVYDIELISDDNIWVVGLFYLPDPDSSFDGSGRQIRNLAHWDGIAWEYQLVHYRSEIWSIRYFSDNDIWISLGVPAHWDGSEWTLYNFWSMGIFGNNDHSTYEMWGNSSDNMYFVGAKGTLVHWDGISFTKIESYTDIDLKAGYSSGEDHFYLAGSNYDDGRSILLEVEGEDHAVLYEYYGDGTTNYGPDSFAPILLSIWYDEIDAQFWGSGGFGVVRFNFDELEHPVIHTHEQMVSDIGMIIYGEKITGQGSNDIFVVGNSTALHWNGVSWHKFDEIEINSGFHLYCLDVRNGVVVMGGEQFPPGAPAGLGLLIKGVRN